MSDMQKRFDRLPVWAKDEINRLNRDIAHYKNIIQRIKLKKTRISYSILGTIDKKTHLDERTVINFNLSKEEEFENRHFEIISIMLNSDNSSLIIHGGNGICVLPAASNSVEIKLKER